MNIKSKGLSANHIISAPGPEKGKKKKSMYILVCSMLGGRDMVPAFGHIQ